MGQKKENTPSLEENFTRLEEVMEQLEAEDVTLEDSFAAYSKGMQLLKDCNAQIDKVEKKVLKLSANGELEELE